jgi:II/X family phage/plasmid replication protein
MVVPCKHPEPINGGQVLSVKPSGEIEWACQKRSSVRGSYSSEIHIRTAKHTAEQNTHIEISGNPVKFFQGHNLWGTDDLQALVIATIEHIAHTLAIGTSDDHKEWQSGNIQLTRVDCTQSFHLESSAAVLAWLRAAEQTAYLSHRGRGQLTKGSTLYFGKHSRRWSLKLYAKGQEVRRSGHGQESIIALPHALAWADKTLRAELTLRSMELKRIGKSLVSDWSTDYHDFERVTGALLRERFEGMTMTTTENLSSEIIQSFRPALRTAYLSWQSGVDLRQVLTRRSFYRYRKELLKHEVDIATVLPKDLPSNVVPLFRTLEAIPATVPAWAIGTSLYFEPRCVNFR